MHLRTSFLLAALLASGCLADRVVTLDPPPAQVTPLPSGQARPVTLMPFSDRRGAIAEGGYAGGTDAVGGLYGLRGWPAAMLVTEPYPVTLQRALATALAARGIPVTVSAVEPPAGTTTPGTGAPEITGTYVLSGTIVDFYGYSNWGAAATLRAYVRLSGPDGAYVTDKTISREVKQFGLDTITPKLEEILGKVITAWVEAVASDPQLTAPLLTQ
jgi:hypothetical protein